MKKLFLLFALCLPSCAGTNNVTFILPSITGTPGYTQTLTLTPTTAPRGGDTGIITGTPATYTVPTNGTLTVTNLATGTNAYYRCDVRGLGKTTTFYVFNSLTNYVTDAKNILVLNDTSTGIYGWSTDAADARYAPLGDYQSGITTNLSAYTSQFGTAAWSNATAFALATNFTGHTNLTTTAHGGIVASTDARLTDARTPITHGHGTNQAGSQALTNLTANPNMYQATNANLTSWGSLVFQVSDNHIPALSVQDGAMVDSPISFGGDNVFMLSEEANSVLTLNADHKLGGIPIGSLGIAGLYGLTNGITWVTNTFKMGDGTTNTIIYLSH